MAKEDRRKRTLHEPCAECNENTKEVERNGENLLCVCVFVGVGGVFSDISIHIHLNSVLKLYFLFRGHYYYYIPYIGRWVWYIRMEWGPYIFLSLPFPKLLGALKRVFSPCRSNTICIFVFMYLIIDLRSCSSFFPPLSMWSDAALVIFTTCFTVLLTRGRPSACGKCIFYVVRWSAFASEDQS